VAIYLVFLMPALHPLLLPTVGVASHLLWFAHVLPVAWTTYHYGRRGGILSLAFGQLLVVGGERAFGAGYFKAADWQTVISLAVALGFTNALVAGFAAYARSARSLQEQLWHSQKMETLGLFAASVAHDFNNMITAITLSAEMVLEDMDPTDTRRELITEIQRSAERATLLSKRLLAFGRRDAVKSAEVNVADVVRDIESMLRRLVPSRVKMCVVTQQVPIIISDRGHIDQIVMNLVVNAGDAIPEAGTITVEARTALPREVPEQRGAAGLRRYVLLEVRDTGVGMDAALQRQIFDPLFTTKPPAKGTGLGLSTVRDLVATWQGFVTVSSSVGDGSVFRVFLPTPPTSIPSASATGPDARQPGFRLAS
jgi:signal transduction histidine kinase